MTKLFYLITKNQKRINNEFLSFTILEHQYFNKRLQRKKVRKIDKNLFKYRLNGSPESFCIFDIKFKFSNKSFK